MNRSTEGRTIGQRLRAIVAVATAVMATGVAAPVWAQNFAPDIEVMEGNDANFAITMPHGLNAAVRWQYETENGTATSGDDYTAASGYLTISAGDTTGEVAVGTSRDSVSDDGETFKLRLHSFQMQRASGQWASEAVYGVPGEKAVTATIREGT